MYHANSPLGFASTTAARYRKIQKDVARQIRESGRCVLSIFPDGVSEKAAKGDDRSFTPAFTYTIGNYLKGGPELLTFYPSAPTCRFLLNTLSEALLSGEIHLSPGEAKEVTGFLGEEGEVPVRLRYLTELELAYSSKNYTIQLPDEASVVLVEPPLPSGHFADSPGSPESFSSFYAEKGLRITKEMVAASL